MLLKNHLNRVLLVKGQNSIGHYSHCCFTFFKGTLNRKLELATLGLESQQFVVRVPYQSLEL